MASPLPIPSVVAMAAIGRRRMPSRSSLTAAVGLRRCVAVPSITSGRRTPRTSAVDRSLCGATPSF